MQKRFVLHNINKLYVAFHEEHPTVSTGFSKFAELLPKHGIFTGARGTHTACAMPV
jgi:hypothetical protein